MVILHANDGTGSTPAVLDTDIICFRVLHFSNLHTHVLGWKWGTIVQWVRWTVSVRWVSSARSEWEESVSEGWFCVRGMSQVSEWASVQYLTQWWWYWAEWSEWVTMSWLWVSDCTQWVRGWVSEWASERASDCVSVSESKWVSEWEDVCITHYWLTFTKCPLLTHQCSLTLLSVLTH